MSRSDLEHRDTNLQVFILMDVLLLSQSTIRLAAKGSPVQAEVKSALGDPAPLGVSFPSGYVYTLTASNRSGTAWTLTSSPDRVLHHT